MAAVVTKMCCVFCRSAGKPESVWSSHWVKDAPGSKGKVICRALLANECGYCHEIGHTPKFCPKLKARDARRRAAAKRRNARPASKRSNARSADGKRPSMIVTHPFATIAKVQKPVALHPPSGAVPPPCSPRAPAGIWANKPVPFEVAASVAHDRELTSLKAELEAMKRKLAAAEQTKALKAHLTEVGILNAVGEQTLEQTAEGEAFFDNVADAADAVEAIHAMEQPTLMRQGAFGFADDASAPLPLRREAASAASTACDECTLDQPPSIPLPDNCDLDADFGEAGTDGWGSE